MSRGPAWSPPAPRASPHLPARGPEWRGLARGLSCPQAARGALALCAAGCGTCPRPREERPRRAASRGPGVGWPVLPMRRAQRGCRRLASGKRSSQSPPAAAGAPSAHPQCGLRGRAGRAAASAREGPARAGAHGHGRDGAPGGQGSGRGQTDRGAAVDRRTDGQKRGVSAALSHKATWAQHSSLALGPPVRTPRPGSPSLPLTPLAPRQPPVHPDPQPGSRGASPLTRREPRCRADRVAPARPGTAASEAAPGVRGGGSQSQGRPRAPRAALHRDPGRRAPRTQAVLTRGQVPGSGNSLTRIATGGSRPVPRAPGPEPGGPRVCRWRQGLVDAACAGTGTVRTLPPRRTQGPAAPATQHRLEEKLRSPRVHLGGFIRRGLRGDARSWVTNRHHGASRKSEFAVLGCRV